MDNYRLDDYYQEFGKNDTEIRFVHLFGPMNRQRLLLNKIKTAPAADAGEQNQITTLFCTNKIKYHQLDLLLQQFFSSSKQPRVYFLTKMGVN